MNSKTVAILLSIILFMSYASLPAMPEGPSLDDRIKKGIYQFRQENYDEALNTLTLLNEENPQNTLISYYLGLTYKRMENYTQAEVYLKQAITNEPKIKGALIELIDTLYRIDKLEDAKQYIKLAEDEGIRPAQSAFLKGLTLLKSGEYDAAIESFTNAKSLDVEMTEVSDYQIGVCLIKKDRFTEAKNVFREISETHPDSDASVYARKYVEAIDKKLEAEKPLSLFLRVAFEYDTNVVLFPDNEALISDISDKSDTREVYTFKGDYNFRTKDNKYSMKVGYGGKYSMQNRITSYNYFANSFSAQPSINMDQLLITFPVYYTHTIVDAKNYVSSINVGNVNNYVFLDNNMVQAGILYQYDDFLRPPYGDEDRTGNTLMGTAGIYHFMFDNKGFVNLRYDLSRDWTEGANWDYLGNKIHAGALVPFFDKFKLVLNGEIFFRNFQHSHTVYDKKRSDQIYSVSSLLSYEFMKNTEVQVQYTYINERSNLELYKYARHIVTGAVQYRF